MGTVGRLIRRLVIAAQLAALAVSFYQTAITIAGEIRGAPRRERRVEKLPRFALVVCARNEERVVADIVGDLLAQDYPREKIEVLVVAHNCQDGTARVAHEAGARVLAIRTRRTGKALAVLAGLEHLDHGIDLVGVFDADARVNPTFLRAVAAASQGEQCLQIETVPQPARNWLAHGYGLGRRARNVFWWRPREALGLGSTINGSGFFIRPELGREVVPTLLTVTEDLELTARLYARGHRIAYVSSTQVFLQEPERLRPAVHQRARWARGHFAVIRHAWLPVAVRALHGDVRAFDMALYLVVPTRTITRVGVTLIFLMSLARAPFALARWPALAGFASEWLLTAVIAFRARLVPRNLTGLRLALRHSILGLMWFPIGVWALCTAGRRTWVPTPRAIAQVEEGHAVAVG
jgi:cellulose synthase/poly-beta-1,6-N-acetylglucosamine synthase-like glycosyltransferase